MNPSIRKYLLINLLLGVTIIILLTAIINYYLAQNDIEKQMDMLLGQSAFAIQALFSDDYEKRNINKVQSNVNQIPTNLRQTLERYHSSGSSLYQNALAFQIWKSDDTLLLRTNNAPIYRLSDQPHGYSFKSVNGVPWRTFSLFDPESKVTIIVAERFNNRHAFGRTLSNDYLLTILFAYPLLGLLIWSIVGRGLGSLKRVTNELSHRDRNYLEPVDVQSVPYEIRPLVDELNQLFMRLHEAFEREKRFAGDAAHELRTPLAALKTQAQVALKQMHSEETHHSLVNVIRGVDRCTHMVEQLLTLSRLVPEASSINDMAEIHLPNLIAEILADLVPAALDKKIDIELKVDDPNIYVMGNATSINILTRNLVDNSIRYTPESGSIIVRVFMKDGQATLRVQDTGPGIPPELRARVFERFYRVLGTKAPGSGLGLAIVQQIAELHSATVTLSSPETGSGLIVDVMFPISQH